MRQLLRPLCIVLLVLSIMPVTASADRQPKKPAVVPNTVLVRLRPGAVTLGQPSAVLGADVYAARPLLQEQQSLTASMALRKRMSVLSGARLAQMIEAEQPLLRTFVLKYAGNEDPFDFAERLMAENPAVEIAEPSYIPRHFAPPNDPLLSQQEMLEVVHALEAWDIYDGDESMVIAVSDDGVNQQHEDLIGSIWTNTGEIPNNGVDDDGNGYVDDYNGYNFAADDDGRQWGDTYNTRQHGTSVAGVLAATHNNHVGLAGVAGKCKIFPLKIAPFGTQSLDYGYESIVYAAVNGFKVLNCSWGIDVYSDINQSIIDFAVSRDVAVIAAAGNDGDSRLVYPAAYNGVMGVGNCWPDDILYSESAYGAHVDIVAPGEGAPSTANSGYTTFGGTSGAAPIVSGTVALVRALRPELTALQALEFVRLCTDDITLQQNPDKRGLVPGRVNMLKAVTGSPLAGPGLAVTAHALKNATGTVVNRFAVGEIMTLSLRMKNVLGPTDGVLCSLSVLADPGQSVEVLNAEQITPALAAGQELVLEGLTMKKAKENPATVFLRVDFTADNDYTSYVLIPFRPSVGFAVFGNDSLEFALTDGGQMGFETRMKYADDRGFHLRSYGNFLYEGGLMAAAGNGRVVSATRSHLYNSVDGTTEVDRDFAVIKPFLAPNPTTGVIRDDNAATPIGLEIRQRVNTATGSGSIAAVEVSVTNVSGQVLQDVSVGYFFDWDIGRYGENNTMDLLYNGPVSLGGTMVWGVASRPGEYPVVGCGVYSLFPGAEPQFAEFDNYSSDAANPLTTGFGFAQSDKIRTLTEGTSIRFDGSGDVGCVTGVRFPGSWPSGETREFVLLLGAHWTQAGLQDALDSYWPVTSVHEPVADGARLRLFPQPARDLVEIAGSVDGSGQVTLTVVDAFGVAVLPVQTIATDGAHHLQTTVDTRALASGVYFVRVQSAAGAVHSVPLVVVK